MPIFFTLWFISMDVVPLLFGGVENAHALYQIRCKTSIVFGAGILLLAYWIDLKRDRSFAFWAYLFGILTFWAGLSIFLETSSEYKRFVYLLINIGLMLLSAILQRVVLLIFGGLGVLLYASSIFYQYFANSLVFPFFFSAIGVLTIFAGIVYRKHYARLQVFILNSLSLNIRKWIPK